MWSYKTQFGTFVIKKTDTLYELFFHEQFGDVVRLTHNENLAEIWSYLLTIKRIKTQNSSYALDVSQLGIPTALCNWSSNS